MWSEMQGIVGPVYIGGRRHEIDDVAMIPETPVEPEVSAILRGADHGEAWKLPAVRFSVRVPQGERAYLRINLSRNLFAVRVDGRGLDIMGPFSQGWHSNSVELPEDCAGRECLVEIQHVDHNPRTLLQAVQLWTAPINGRLSHWGWKPMVGDVGFATTTTPQPEADPRRNPTGDEGPVLLLPDSWKSAPAESSGVPTFFRTRFPRPAGEQPVFLDIGAMFKGQIYLNGRNAGRFWGTGGTQTQYYLPRAWMADDNELVLFEERGRHPTNVALTYAGNPPCIELAMTLGTAAT
jgi:hypothetical protein